MADYTISYRKRGQRSRKAKRSRKISVVLIAACAIVIGFLVLKKSPRPPNLAFLNPATKVYFDDSTTISWKTKVNEQIETDEEYELTENPKSADILVTNNFENSNTERESCEILYQVDLFPVARFATIRDGITLNELKAAAKGEGDDLSFVYPTEYEEEIVLALEVAEDSSLSGEILGKLNGEAVDTRAALMTALEKDSNFLAMVPASWLGPDMKIIEVDEKFPLEESGMFRVEKYLCDKTGREEDPLAAELKRRSEESGAVDSVSLENTATVIQTGVTAMGRNLWTKMRTEDDPAWVARKIGEFLADADLTHTSNEVSFSESCSQQSGTMAFCSDPEFIEALKLSGIDVVELTGNHNNDWGRDDAEYSIELYNEHEIDYFGGGLDLEDAQVPYIAEIKGTRIGFLGYNYYDSVVSGNPTPLATTTLPGANRYDEEQIESDIKALREGYEEQAPVDIIIVDLQFQECWCYSEGNTNCYRPDAVPDQTTVFRNIRDMGADIVVGTQAHQPQGFEMSEEGALFYGLGNLFFDQTVYTGTREEEIIKHYFYNGRHLTSRVYTAMYDKSYQPELVDGETRDEILEKLF